MGSGTWKFHKPFSLLALLYERGPFRICKKEQEILCYSSFISMTYLLLGNTMEMLSNTKSWLPYVFEMKDISEAS